MADVSSLPGAVDGRDAAQGFGAGFEDEIIDGKFDAFLLESGVELGADREQRIGVNFDIEVDVRNRRG